MMNLEHCWKIKKRLDLTSVVSRKKKIGINKLLTRLFVDGNLPMSFTELPKFFIFSLSRVWSFKIIWQEISEVDIFL